MAGKWTEESTLKFVELYRDHECLWNTQLLVYRNKQARATAIKSIVNEMNITGFNDVDVKNKIKNLRSTYGQEVAKIRKSEHSGMRTSEIYEPKMKWFAIMKIFLKGIDKKRETLSNFVSLHFYCYFF